jgi:hypothetical protein
MRRIATISFFFLFASACAFCISQTSTVAGKLLTYGDPEGYAVLSQLIDKAVPSKTSEIDISATTSRGEYVGTTEGCLKVPDEFSSALKDFHKRNESTMRLANGFSLRSKYALRDKPEVVTPPQSGPDSQQLDEKFVPRTFFTVSAVGFDESETHAIAYVGAYCGVMCAGGAYYLLIKGKDGWKEIPDSPKCEWMSLERGPANPRRPS